MRAAGGSFCYDSFMNDPKKPIAKPSKDLPKKPDSQKDVDLAEQVARLTEMAARAQADLQNARIRMSKDAEDLRKFAAEEVMLRLLPIIDNFQRAFLHLPDDLKANEWVKGVAAIEQSLLKQVADLGLVKMEVLGKDMDPAFHEVLMQGPGPNGKITEVLEEGYELHGRVIRPAKVKVGDGT